MKNKVFTTIFLGVFIFVIGITGVFAQKSDNKMEMMDKSEMAEMMKSQHHQVMMTYRNNLLSVMKTLENLAKADEAINAEFARELFKDIERSSEMMKRIHQDHMGKMDSKMKEKMAPMMEKMKTRQTELNHHIMALGKEINADSINSAEVQKHTSAIIEMFDKEQMDMKNKNKMHDGMKHI